MGRVSEKHLRYRTKDRIIEDVTFVLSSPLSYGAKWAVLKDVAWVWTEFHGKTKGCPYWTKLALEQYRHDKKVKLRHEHIVPKSLVIKMFFDLVAPTADQVRDICERYLIAVVVSLQEDRVLNMEFGRTMPPEFYDPNHAGYRDPWLRYKKYGIEVVACNEHAVALPD